MPTLCLGEVLVDLICEQPVASAAEATSFVPHFGGSPANVAVIAARSGAKVAFAGAAGNDAWGTWLRWRLARERVNVAAFRRADGVATPVSFITVDAQGIPTSTLYGDGIEAGLAALDEDAVLRAADAADALVIGSNTLVDARGRALTAAARSRVLERERPVIFDPNLLLDRWDDVEEAAEACLDCVEGAFLVTCTAEEATALTGDHDTEAAAAVLLGAGARHVVVTLESGGAILRGGGLDLRVPGVPARAIDTTGADDVLLGTILGRLAATGFYAPAIAAALPAAVAAAARSTERWGAVGAVGA